MTENDVNTISAEANGDKEKTKGFDYDGYYKDLIECFFYPLLKRTIPELYEIADTNVKPRLLDKEFRDILNTSDPEVHTSPHFADYVIEVPIKNGDVQWILCHVEAQGPGGGDISERMFLYMCLIYAHYRRMPVGLVIITDGHKKEERFYSHKQFGVSTLYEYYSVVLADLDDEELQASDNPIDLALYAAKCALRAKEELQKYTYLRTLTDLLTERGWDVNDKRNLLLFIRRIINLKDKALQELYLKYSLELRKGGNTMYDWMKEAEERMVEQRGEAKKAFEVARSMRADGLSPDVIKKYTGLDREDILALG